MKKKVFFSLFFSILAVAAYCANAIAPDTDSEKESHALRIWKAGEVVSRKAIRQFGEEKCFRAEEISGELLKRISGKSYKKNCTVPLKELRYIKVLHYNLKGETLLGEMICNKAVCNDLIAIFRTLYQAEYPIERMVLIDEYDADDERSMQANNSSAFNFRFVSGTRKLSSHSLGMAVDINPLYNPYVKKGKSGKTTVYPQNAMPYVDRTKTFPFKIDKNDLCYKEFIKRGFTWGGSWRSLKDYQHFEKTK